MTVHSRELTRTWQPGLRRSRAAIRRAISGRFLQMLTLRSRSGQLIAADQQVDFFSVERFVLKQSLRHPHERLSIGLEKLHHEAILRRDDRANLSVDLAGRLFGVAIDRAHLASE